MKHDPRTGLPDEKLATELFALVEYHQGMAFISDGIEVLSRKEIFDLARASIANSQIVVRKLKQFMLKEEKP